MGFKQAEEKFFEWMATTRTGSIFKIAVGAVLVWAMDAVADWNLPPVLMVAIVAIIPVVINELNPRDGRYGVGSGDGK